MIKEEVNNMSYEDFLKEYVLKTEYAYNFVFTYKGKTYQFDYDFDTHPKINGVLPRRFFVYSSTDIMTYEVLSCTWYSSFLEAINSVKIEGKSFKEIYHDPDSEIIDLN